MIVELIERGFVADEDEEIPCFDTYPAPPPPTQPCVYTLAELYEGNT